MKCDCVNFQQPFLVLLLCPRLQPTDPNNSRRWPCVWLWLWRTVVQGLMQTLPWEKVSSLSSNFALSTSHAKSWVCLKTPRFTGHFGESKKLVILAKAKKVSRPLMLKHEMMPPWPLYSGHLGDYKHCSFNFDSKHDVNIWTISLWSDLTLACFCVNIDISLMLIINISSWDWLFHYLTNHLIKDFIWIACLVENVLCIQGISLLVAITLTLHLRNILEF